MGIILTIFSAVLVLTVFLSLIKNDFWLFKILEYPRLQKLVLIAMVLVCWLLWPPQAIFQQILAGILVAAFIYLLYKVWPYTIIAKKEMQKVSSGDASNEVKIFAANVLQENTNYPGMLQQIKEADPDIIFLLETNARWAKAMEALKDNYPYSLRQPLENTYGLLFYSRLPVENGSINFLVKKEVPSIEAAIMLRSGQKIKIWGLHPEPPVPGENLFATAKDKELMKVAFKARECQLPCIVFGDLNDVAWSHTTELFRKTSELLDPRRGRGFYSTFSAHHWFIRYPLDYIFCSKEFGLISMVRMPKNGSDHFATLTHLAFRPDMQAKQQTPKADREELGEAKEMATQPVKE